MKPLPVLINNLDDVQRLVDRIYQAGNMYTYDFETVGNRPRKLKVAGLGLAFGYNHGQASYIVTEHESFRTLKWESVLEIVRPLFEDSTMTAVAHNQLFDATILDVYGVKLHTNTYDTMIMNWLLNTESNNRLKDIILRIYKYRMKELSDICNLVQVDWHPGKILAVDKAPMEQLADYAVDDVLQTYRLALDEIKAIKADPKLDKIYHKIYRRFLLVLTAMESDGIQIDSEALNSMEVLAASQLDSLTQKLQEMRDGQDFDPKLMVNTYRMIDTMGLDSFLAAPQEVRENCIKLDKKDIPELQTKWKDRKNLRQQLYDAPHLAHKVYNLNSNNHLNTLLFKELELTPRGEKNKLKQYTVDAKALIKLQVEDDSGYVSTMLRYRRLHKLHSQYMVGLTPLLDDDGRLRTSFNPALKTGRLSSRTPNLQNIIHDDEFPIRSVFVARPGHDLTVLDYSQMELRILAHYSQDETMMNGFINGFDPHSITAQRVFNLPCPVEEVAEKYPKYRKIAKTINFGVVYGVGARSLVEQIADATKGEVVPSEAEAQGYMNKLFEEFPGIEAYIKGMKATARKIGKVTTLFGRPRHLPDAKQQVEMKRYYGALRRAANSPIQGTAADIIGLAMCNIRDILMEKELWRNGVWMCLQVHDELIFEVRKDLTQSVLPILEDAMKSAVELRVPLDASGGFGPNWIQAK